MQRTLRNMVSWAHCHDITEILLKRFKTTKTKFNYYEIYKLWLHIMWSFCTLLIPTLENISYTNSFVLVLNTWQYTSKGLAQPYTFLIIYRVLQEFVFMNDGCSTWRENSLIPGCQQDQGREFLISVKVAFLIRVISLYTCKSCFCMSCLSLILEFYFLACEYCKSLCLSIKSWLSLFYKSWLIKQVLSFSDLSIVIKLLVIRV